jgi:hypothetical protein
MENHSLADIVEKIQEHLLIEDWDLPEEATMPTGSAGRRVVGEEEPRKPRP